jgi:hypothetical protein
VSALLSRPRLRRAPDVLRRLRGTSLPPYAASIAGFVASQSSNANEISTVTLGNLAKPWASTVAGPYESRPATE